jgi:hypothetical protein
MEEWTRTDGKDPAPTPLTITIELEPEADPVAGTVAVEGREERRFSGWMELSSAIAAAHEKGRMPRTREDLEEMRG